MAIAKTITRYLGKHKVPYRLVPHQHTASGLHTARKANISPGSLAKAVLLDDVREPKHFMMAVVPASHQVELSRLSQQLGRPVRLATEAEASALFPDCELGAIPPVGTAYGIETVVDDSLLAQEDLYFEAGDHELLIHLASRNFRKLLENCLHGHFSRLM